MRAGVRTSLSASPALLPSFPVDAECFRHEKPLKTRNWDAWDLSPTLPQACLISPSLPSNPSEVSVDICFLWSVCILITSNTFSFLTKGYGVGSGPKEGHWTLSGWLLSRAYTGWKAHETLTQSPACWARWLHVRAVGGLVHVLPGPYSVVSKPGLQSSAFYEQPNRPPVKSPWA